MARTLQALRRERGGDRVSVPTGKKRIVYPDSDGKPMADNTKQFNWIVKIKEGLEVLFADRADVFVAGDLLWYPFEGDNKTRTAPDAMVAFGRPKGDRGSYRQWEEDGIAPQVVFEVLSPGNTKREMEEKRAAYEKYGVEEYYEYDPDRNVLKGWLRSGNRLAPIENMSGWVSPRLGIRFEPGEDDLEIFRPDGQKFLSPVETEREKMRIEKEKKQAERGKKQAEREKKQAEREKKQAEKEKMQAEREKMQAERERKQAEREKKRAEKEKKQAEKEKKQAEAKAEKEKRQAERERKQAEREKKQVEAKAERERKRAEQAEARAEMLAAKLRELGIDADS